MREGWTRRFGEAKWHYYGPSEGQHLLYSLCGKFVTFKATGLKQGDDDHPDNCKKCLQTLRGRDAKREGQNAEIEEQVRGSQDGGDPNCNWR